MTTPDDATPSRWRGWHHLPRDVAFSARSLLRAKAFSATVILTLALGMYLTVTVWHFTSSTMFLSVPYRHPESLYSVGLTTADADFSPMQFAVQLQAYREQKDVFEEMSASTPQLANVVVDNEPVASGVSQIMDGSFKMLGITPERGRAFLPDESRAGANDVVIVSHRFWQKQLHANPDVLGSTLRVGEQTCRIVGVFGDKQQLPIGFNEDVLQPWVPKYDPAKPWEVYMFSMVRLKRGVTPEQAVLAMQRAKVNVSPALAQWVEKMRPALRKPNQMFRPEIYHLLFGAALFLFAIACLNSVNLMLVRVLGRNREFSIRLAIGGTQAEVIRLVAIEAVLLATIAGMIVYVCTSSFTSHVLAAWSEYPGGETQLWTAWSTHACLMALVIIAAVLLSGSAAWRLSHGNINAGLKDGGASTGESRSAARARSLLVVMQAAFAVVLLGGAGLMISTFQKLAKVDFGFDPNGKVTVSIVFPDGYTLSDEARLQLFENLAENFRRLPGVRQVGYGTGLSFWTMYGEGEPSLRMPDGSLIGFAYARVSEHFPDAAGLHLVKGRWMSQSKGAQEVVINESLARKRFGDENPIGQVMLIKNNGKDWQWTVSGVVHDVRPGLRLKPKNEVYTLNSWWAPSVNSLLLRYDQDPPPENESVIRRTIYRINPRIIPMAVGTLNEQLRQSEWLARVVLNVLRWLSGVALLLATVGLFSVLAYNVDRRRPEFGVRLALGASPESIVRLVLRRGLVIAAVGVLIGCSAAAGLSRLLASLLYETGTFEPIVYLSVALGMLLAAFAACWIPARRAAQVDVCQLLRSE